MGQINTGIYKFFDALSLSGAIIFIFAGLTVFGVIIQNEKVWQNFGTALTTFVSGKQLARSEQSNQILAQKQPNPDVEILPEPEVIQGK
jgi:hypothetical protein